MGKKERSKIIGKIIWGLSVILSIVAAAVLMFVLSQNKLKREVVIGLSAPMPAVNEFLIDTSEGGEFITDMSKINTGDVGAYDVEITIKNVIYKSKLIIKDNIPPAIDGVGDKMVYLGDTVSYRQGVSVRDNIDDKVDLEIDSSNVNLNQVGIYEVIYKAIDKSGNTTTASMKVNVVEKPAQAIDLQELNVLTDEVLASILTEGMTKYQKAEVIYDWVKNSISYINYSDKDSWVKGAYEGLTIKKGDCFVYFATAKQLLTRAGIDNIDVKELDGKHYWNMINVGDGWYHFDTTRFQDSKRIFMWTDAQVEEVYTAGTKLHNWDRTTTPPTPEN